MTKSIDLIWIVVSDINKAISYYTDVLGFVLKEHNEQYGWAELSGKAGGARLGLAQARKEEIIKPGQNAVVAVTVDNLEKTKQSFKKQGVKLIGDTLEVPGVVKMQTFADQDGNLFQLAETLN